MAPTTHTLTMALAGLHHSHFASMGLMLLGAALTLLPFIWLGRGLVSNSGADR